MTRTKKSIQGRKRHVAIDTRGQLVGVAAHPADIQDREGAGLAVGAIHDLFPRLRHLFADSVYNGPQLHKTRLNSATGPSRSSSASPLPALSCCRAAGITLAGSGPGLLAASSSRSVSTPA
jgi:Transposase DDE domain